MLVFLTKYFLVLVREGFKKDLTRVYLIPPPTPITKNGGGELRLKQFGSDKENIFLKNPPVRLEINYRSCKCFFIKDLSRDTYQKITPGVSSSIVLMISDSFSRTEQMVFLSILLSLILMGNIIVIMSLVLSRTRKSRMDFFILHLAAAGRSRYFYRYFP